MIAVHKRSGVKHMIHKDGLATVCGRILYKANWKLFNAGKPNCRSCQSKGVK